MTLAERALTAYDAKVRQEEVEKALAIQAKRTEKVRVLIGALSTVLGITLDTLDYTDTLEWHAGRDEEGWCTVQIDGLYFAYDTAVHCGSLQLMIPFGSGWQSFIFKSLEELGELLYIKPYALTAKRETAELLPA